MKFYKEINFKETPIGKIPKDWNISRLGDNLVEVETGKRAKGGALSQGSVASIGGEHIGTQGNIQWNNMKFIPDDFYFSLKQGKVKQGDILLVKDGATTGKVAIAKELRYKKVAVNEHVFVIRCKTNKLTNYFLFYFLFSKFGQIQIKNRFHGMIGGITRKDLETILIPIPSIYEQQGIVEVLSCVDLAIQKVDEAIARAERLKRGLMQQLLTKGIGHKEFKETPIGKIPKDWEIVRLGDALELCQYGLSIPMSNQGKYPIIRMDEIVDGYVVPTITKYVDLDDKTFRDFKLEKGDILFNRTNAYELVGRTGIFLLDGDYVFASYLLRLRPNREIFDSHFLTFYLIYSQSRIRQLATKAVHQANINATNLKRLIVPKPSLPEQKKIAEILVSMDNVLRQKKGKKEKLVRMKKRLMDLFLTGKVRVSV